jgi:hypothetical protein
MEKIDKIKELREARLNARKEGKGLEGLVLGTLLGEVENDLSRTNVNSNDAVENAAKKMVKGLETVGDEQSKKEIEILEQFLPRTMTQDQIKEVLDTYGGIKDAPNFGAKMGLAMSVLQGKADGKDVKAVIQANYL